MHRTLPVVLPFVAAITSLAAAQHWTEQGDAPDFPGGVAQPVTGSGTLLTITGETTTGTDDFVDAYLIEIVDAASFHATTDPALDPAAAAEWDTRLFLFDADGNPLLANDDAPGQPGARSFVSDPDLFPGTVDATAAPLANGTYVLVITGWANDPEDAGGLDLFALDSDFDALFGPDPAAGPFDHWENLHGLTMSGGYTIALQGAAFIAGASCTGDVNLDGQVDVNDLLLLLAAWGTGDPAADIDGSGTVNVDDLLILLGAWGACS